MRKNKHDNVLEAVPAAMAVTTAVIMSGYFKMGFWGTFASALLAGIVLLFITWILRNISKKKLSIIFTKTKISNEKFKVIVLLWNHSWFKSVYSSDYGECGLGLVTDYGTIVDRLNKPIPVKIVDSFNYYIIPDKSENVLNLSMDSLPPGALIEFSFEIKRLEAQNEDSLLALPYAVKTNNRFNGNPTIRLHYERANLNIRELKYSKRMQTFHWICRGAAVSTIIATIIAAVTVPKNVSDIIGAGLMVFAAFVTAPVAWGNFVPPSVVKYMKINHRLSKKR